jgi:hypothetical protein
MQRLSNRNQKLFLVGDNNDYMIFFKPISTSKSGIMKSNCVANTTFSLLYLRSLALCSTCSFFGWAPSSVTYSSLGFVRAWLENSFSSLLHSASLSIWNSLVSCWIFLLGNNPSFWSTKTCAMRVAVSTKWLFRIRPLSAYLMLLAPYWTWQ